MIDLITTGARHQNQYLSMMQSGLKGEISILKHLSRLGATKSDVAICWGIRHLHEISQHYETVVVMEQGYFSNRLQNLSVGIGGLNGRANFGNQDSPSDRWEKHGVSMQDWKEDGDYYLIMGQVDGDMSIDGVNIHTWYRTIADEIEQKTDVPVYFRPHPLSRNSSGLIQMLDGELESALSDAKGVITYNSNSAVDAALAGIPVLAHDQGSMAWDIAAHSIDELINFEYPDREQWAYNLAYAQWTQNELIDGTAWSHISNEIYKQTTDHSADS